MRRQIVDIGQYSKVYEFIDENDRFILTSDFYPKIINDLINLRLESIELSYEKDKVSDNIQLRNIRNISMKLNFIDRTDNYIKDLFSRLKGLNKELVIPKSDALISDYKIIYFDKSRIVKQTYLFKDVLPIDMIITNEKEFNKTHDFIFDLESKPITRNITLVCSIDRFDILVD